MTKDELIQTIESEWNNLQASLDGLTEEQMHQPGVVGSGLRPRGQPGNPLPRVGAHRPETNRTAT